MQWTGGGLWIAVQQTDPRRGTLYLRGDCREYTLQMPAEGIHLSALDDVIANGPAAITRHLESGPRRAAARLGTLFVDLPYFDRFGHAVLNFLLGRPLHGSAWGDTLHQRMPIALGMHLMRIGSGLAQRSPSSLDREKGALIIAFALGYIAHAAVDRSLHPLVNRMARARSQKTGRPVEQEHHEVEKYQSILFHEERFGIDMMGRQFLFNYLDIDGALLCGPAFQIDGGPLWWAVQEALVCTHGEAPSLDDFRRWTRSLDRYRTLLTSPLGRTLVLDHEKLWERPGLYDAVRFPLRYRHAVQQAVRWTDTLLRWGHDGRFDGSAQHDLLQQIPEGSIDPMPPPGAPDDLD